MQSRPIRILLAEPPGASADALRNTLLAMGYVVAVADSNKLPDQLDSDLAIVRLASREPSDATPRTLPEVPVVYLVARDDLTLARRAQGSNSRGFLLEPFDDMELELIIENELDRHRTERDLRESEQWLTSILRSIGTGVVASDAEWRVRFINRAAEDLTGWTAEEAIGRTLSEVVPISISAPELVRGGRTQGVLRHRLGKEVSIEESSTTIRNANGKVIGSVITIGAVAGSARVDK